MMLNNSPENPEVDNQRVDTIRSKLDEDSYIVNSRQIADKIIDIEIALSRPQQSTT